MSSSTCLGGRHRAPVCPSARSPWPGNSPAPTPGPPPAAGSSSAADDAAAGAGTAAESNAQETSGTATSEAGHALEVLRPGLQLLIEDLGRPGYNSMGVSGAGAADRTALERGNRLVGNAESAA